MSEVSSAASRFQRVTVAHDDGPSAAPTVASNLLFVLVVSAGYFASAMAGLAISRRSGNIATLWPPNGMLLAALLLTSSRRWSHVLAAGAIGSVTANVYNGSPAVDAASITVANLVEAWIAALILRRRTHQPRLFQQSRDVMVLVGAAVLAAVVAGALSAGSARVMSDAPFRTTFINWVLGDVLGLVVVMPIAVIAHDLLRYGPDLMLSRRSIWETALIMGIVLCVTIGVFLPDMPPVQYLVMPTVLLASYRLGPFGAAMSTVIVAVLGSVGTAAAAQSLASTPYDITLRVFNFQLNLTVLFLTALPIGAAMARRVQLEQALVDEKERTLAYANRMAVLANVDTLTGLATRRHFLDQLRAAVISPGDTAQSLTLAMIDIDHFKSVNDRHGHAMGDAVLLAFGDACRAATRAQDVVGRMGGEEFAVLLPNADEAIAQRQIDRLREAVESIRLQDSAGNAVSVTISIGLAVVEGTDVDALLSDADRALYRAKAQGRNRIVLARRSSDEPQDLSPDVLR